MFVPTTVGGSMSPWVTCHHAFFLLSNDVNMVVRTLHPGVPTTRQCFGQRPGKGVGTVERAQNAEASSGPIKEYTRKNSLDFKKFHLVRL